MDKRPRGPKGASSWLFSMMAMRLWHAGEVAGMVALARSEFPAHQMSIEKSRMTVVNQLIDDVWHACRENNDLQHRGALWRATALLISMPGNCLIYIIRCIINNYYI